MINLYDLKRDKAFRGTYYFTKSANPALKWIRGLAITLYFISIIGFSSLISPFIGGQLVNRFDKEEITQEIKNSNDLANSPYEVKAGDEAIDNTFKLFIPKISLESDIVPNVDTVSEEIYKQKLKYGVAHANGSYFPGQKGLVFLFAHSTNSVINMLEYNAKFMELNKLDIGDNVQLNYQGKIYQYQITDKKIINPYELELIRQADSNLVLATCWPLGTNWQRLVLFAKSTS